MVSVLKTLVLLAGTLWAAGSLLAAPGVSIARPGTVNYAEGAVTVAGQTIGSRQLGQTVVAPGQVISTTDGKAEVLLTPGVLLRLSDHSSARMVSPSITDTRMELLNGQAMIEADNVQKENRIDLVDHGVDTIIEKKGIYRFTADPASVAVFDGKVKVLQNDRGTEVGKGKELALATDVKPHSFDRDQTDGLYAWSKLRSSYMAEANYASAQTVVVGGPGWYGAGWYWNPWYRTYAFLPGDGFLYSPFGFGFYSPVYFYRTGFYPYRPVFRGPVVVRPPASGFVHGGAIRPLGRGARM